MKQDPKSEDSAPERRHFIQVEIDNDLKDGRYASVQTRFPPEPNGYPHIGHAKAICADFGLAEEYGGICNLRFDDTNPAAEEDKFVKAIQDDIRWLGFDWGDNLYFASDFFEQLYGFAQHLIRTGFAYVDDQDLETIRAGRGNRDRPGDPGQNSPFRDRSPEENLELFEGMREGKFEEGACVLRAKIDMGAANHLMRDPVLYRIQKANHHRTGDAWKIYPTYDMAHGQCDALENVSHSLCSLEFENHRPLYDWLLQHLPIEHKPRQIEFARLNITYTVLSKRFLKQLVERKLVDGWDDPRLPTLRGMRRRGFTPGSIRNFCSRIGVARTHSTVELGWLEDELRKDLNPVALRRMAVLDPLKVVIENIAEGESISCQAVNNPEDDAAGTREIQLRREIWIEQDDFKEEANRKFFRLKTDGFVRLRYGYIIHCHSVVKDEQGNITELRCTYNPDSGSGQTPEGHKKVKGIIHWVACDDSVPATVNLYDALFTTPNPMQDSDGKDFVERLNPEALVVKKVCRLEKALGDAKVEDHYQFERLGYFVLDSAHADSEGLVFNRAVPLRDNRPKPKQA